MRLRITVIAAVLAASGFIVHADNTRYVDPTIGNVSKILVPTFPTYHLPNQMIRMYPVSGDYVDDQVTGFPLQVVSHRSPGIMQLSVGTGDGEISAMTYDHDLETRHPWLFSTYLVDDEITLSFSPGKKCAIYKVEFPDNTLKQLRVKGMGALAARQVGPNAFSLEETISYTTRGIDPVTRVMKAYCYVELVDGDGEPVMSSPVELGNNRFATSIAEDGPSTVIIKYAISYISHEQATRNFQTELGSRGFDELVGQGRAEWEHALGKIKVEGGSESQRRTFYTSLYRTYERMVDINEGGRYYSGYDGEVHESDRPFYVDDWVWDSYLAHHPLRTIIDPQKEADMLNSYVCMYEQSGWMPTFPQVHGNHMCMNCFHSSAIFLDGYRKGLRGFDLDKAYQGIRRNLMEATALPWRQGLPKRAIDDFYHEHGYYPALHPGEEETDPMVDSFEKRQSVAVTLGISYDSWVVSQLAGELGNKEDQQFFAGRALNYRKLWDPENLLFMPKDDKGDWIPIDPKFSGGPGGRDYYDENNGWTYAWQVQHDIRGLIRLLGGKEKADARLDQLFREPIEMSRYAFNAEFPDSTGMVGQFSMGNEPSFHIPYLHNFFGAPWKTQKRIRMLLDVWFGDTLFGIPGDEDGGGMTAFVVFSQMGFYPMVPGLPYYTIGSPVFEKTTIDLGNGKSFTVLARGASKEMKYIQQAFLDGREITTPFFTHEALMKGGTLELIMGKKPNKEWGSEADPPLRRYVFRSEGFEAKVFKSSDGSSLNYRIHNPENLNKDQKYPLVLFLHGAGERGELNIEQLLHGVPDILAFTRKSNQPAVIVAPQCPAGERWVETDWDAESHNMPQQPDPQTRLVLELLDDVMKNPYIDKDRIYVTGLSMGGVATWDLIQRHPGLFAAAIPICGGGDTSLASRIKDMPVWVFHGDADKSVPVKRSRDMVSAIRDSGGNVQYTEYPGIGHNSWTATYENSEVLQWLFDQIK